MNTRPHLPPEVIGRITECLGPNFDKDDLRSLALTSRACRMEGQRVLFRTMEVKHDGRGHYLERTRAAIRRHDIFLQAIISAPERLGQYVRAYTCIWLAAAPVNTDFHSNESFNQDLNRTFNRPNLKAAMSLWNKMHRALPLMTRLEHLTLAVGTVLEWGHSTNGVSILRNCHFALKSLVWGSSLDFLTLAADVLPHQPFLQSFGIHHIEDQRAPRVINFPPDALVHLRNIKGPTSALLAFLLGRNVGAVSWTMGSDHDTWEQVGQSLNQTRYLRLSQSWGLNHIAQHLVSVEVLCLKTFSLHWRPDFSQLTSLVSLRTLVLQSQGAWPRDAFDEEHAVMWRASVDAIAAIAFVSCSTLECVLVEGLGDSRPYTTIKRAGDGIEEGDEIDQSEMLEIFEPWMPRPLTNAADVQYYM